MTRRADPAARSDLLDRIVDYVYAHGVGSLSLRALAQELGVSAGLLLYHFRSKEELTVEILKCAGDRQRKLFAEMREAGNVTGPEVCRGIWRVVAAPEARPLLRIFFEVYGLALVDRERFPGVLPGAIENWLPFIAKPFERAGMSPQEARLQATFGLAAIRGFLLDLCATNDDERVGAAVELWISRWT